MHKGSCFWKLFGSERVNESLKLPKTEEKYFYPSLSLVWVDLSYRMSFLVRSEILGLIVTKLNANYEYSRSNTDRLPLSVQMQLFEKLEIFSGLFIAFLESAFNFELSEKKKNVMGQIFLKLMTPKEVFT